MTWRCVNIVNWSCFYTLSLSVSHSVFHSAPLFLSVLRTMCVRGSSIYSICSNFQRTQKSFEKIIEMCACAGRWVWNRSNWINNWTEDELGTHLFIHPLRTSERKNHDFMHCFNALHMHMHAGNVVGHGNMLVGHVYAYIAYSITEMGKWWIEITAIKTFSAHGVCVL